MKKGIIVLLIAVLAVGFAFADVTKFEGSASVSYGVGLDKDPEYGFKNSQSTTFKFDFEFASAEVDNAEHQTDFWAEIGATGWAGYKDSAYKFDVEITKANIHIKDLTINILGPHAAYNYAKSFTINPTTKKAWFDFANNAKFDYAVGGVELLYGGYSLSIAQYKSNGKATAASDASLGEIEYFSADDWADVDPADYVVVANGGDNGVYAAEKIDAEAAVPAKETNTIFVGAETKAFELAEGMTIQAAANGLLSGTKSGDEWNYAKKAGAALKFNYKTDKLSAGIALDADYGAKTISIDALATGSFAFSEKGKVEAKVYFGFAKPEDEDAEKVLEVYAKTAVPAGDYLITVEAEADRLLHVAKTEAQKDAAMHFNKNWAGYTVKASTTIDKLGLSAYFNFNQVVDTEVKAEQSGMNIGVNASYSLEKFKVEGGAAVNFVDKLVDSKYAITLYSIRPTAAISSTALVENCTLKLAWAGARFLVDEDFVVGTFKKTNGTLTASATISF